MIYICSKQGKIDRLWGVFIKHLIQMQEAGIKVEYVKKGEVILNGKRYQPIYYENTMDYRPLGKWEHHTVLIGHDIQPLIDYLVHFNPGSEVIVDPGKAYISGNWRGGKDSETADN